MTDLPTLAPAQAALLNDLMLEHFGPTITEIADDARLFTNDGQAAGPNQFDSLDRLEFVMALEDHFDVEIPDAIASIIHSKADLRQHLATLLAPPATDR